jgi:hypothetical protein
VSGHHPFFFEKKKDGSGQQVQTSKKEANNTFVLPAIRTLCSLFKVGQSPQNQRIQK